MESNPKKTRWVFTSLGWPLHVVVRLQKAFGLRGGYDDVFVRYRVDGDSLLHEPIKELSPVGGPAAVEPESDFMSVKVNARSGRAFGPRVGRPTDQTFCAYNTIVRFGVDRELAGSDSLFLAGVIDELFGQISCLAVRDHPARDVAAEDGWKPVGG